MPLLDCVRIEISAWGLMWLEGCVRRRCCYRSNLNDATALCPATIDIPGQPKAGLNPCGSLLETNDAQKSHLTLTSGRDRIREDTRFRILRLLSDNPSMSQRELAKAVGASVGSAHYLAKALTEVGMIKLANFSGSADKRRYAYVLTAKGLAEKAVIARRFLTRKLEEYDALHEEICALRSEFGNQIESG